MVYKRKEAWVENKIRCSIIRGREVFDSFGSCFFFFERKCLAVDFCVPCIVWCLFVLMYFPLLTTPRARVHFLAQGSSTRRQQRSKRICWLEKLRLTVKNTAVAVCGCWWNWRRKRLKDLRNCMSDRISTEVIWAMSWWREKTGGTPSCSVSLSRSLDWSDGEADLVELRLLEDDRGREK